jgi:stalled ribosome alternative rescue factor ArfA
MKIVKLRSKDTAVKRPKVILPQKGKGSYKRKKVQENSYVACK